MSLKGSMAFMASMTLLALMAIITSKANDYQMALIDVLSLMTLMAELKRP